MALSNEKFAEIMYRYDEKVSRNRHIHEQRVSEIYDKIPGFKDIDISIPSLSFEYGRRLINGEKNAVEELEERIKRDKEKKAELLKEYGYPPDYLDPIYDCKECKDTGYIGSEKCRCLKQAVIRELYDQSNIADMLKYENFDTLSYDYYYDDELEQMESIIKTCRDYVQNFEGPYVNKNILFFGTPGTGKTFLTNCIAKEILDKGYSVIYFTSISLFDKLATYTFRNSDGSDEIEGIREDIFGCDLLIIDDLGTETAGNFVASQFFLIINERNSRKKATIISTNLAMSDLSERYNERTASRLLGDYILINPRISDIRIKKKKQNI
ncbi:MAG: ATP-binding protein [Lachnospiraceae bacterium]|nr:ATP-binding protein [Lachnospiraceae bacterium]